MRCPVCKADNAQGPLCRRCRADVSQLFVLEGQQRRQLASARQAVWAGQWLEAEEQASAALAVQHTPEAYRLLGVVRLLRRDFGGALRSYRCQQAMSAGSAGEAGPRSAPAR